MTAVGAVALTASPLPAPGASWGGERFAGALAHAAQAIGHEELREAASQLVASALFQPILSQLRESPFLEGPFAPGVAERQFAPLLDQHLADRISRAANLPLVDAIVERLSGDRPGPAAATGSTTHG